MLLDIVPDMGKRFIYGKLKLKRLLRKHYGWSVHFEDDERINKVEKIKQNFIIRYKEDDDEDMI